MPYGLEGRDLELYQAGKSGGISEVKKTRERHEREDREEEAKRQNEEPESCDDYSETGQPISGDWRRHK